MKKTYALSFIAILAISLTFSLFPTAFAKHTATVLWLDYRGTPYERSSDTVYRPQWLGGAPPEFSGWPYLSLTIANLESSADPIYKVILIIPRNDTGYALYHYWESIVYNSTDQVAENWKGTPDEIDNSGWPKTVIFETETNPINPGNRFRFDLQFESTRVLFCDNIFFVYTVDMGTDSTHPETWGHKLTLTTDRNPPDNPNIIRPSPTEGLTREEPIIAIFDDYPDDWYMNLEFTVSDMLKSEGADHDTGVSRIEVFIVNSSEKVEWSKVYPEDPQHYWEPPLFPSDPLHRLHINEKVWNLAEEVKPGTFKFRLEINIFDGARNKKHFERYFWFKVPSYFYVTPESGTVGRFDNTQNSLGEWSGSISDTYSGILDDYRLGTEVHAIGKKPERSPGFTPNSYVNIYVYHSLKGKMLVKYHYPTDAEGAFDAPFLFPKGPNGIYKVEAQDISPDHITDFAYFEVLNGVIFMPDVVTGPASVKVIASGLPVEAEEPSVSSSVWVDRLLINGLDSIWGVNNHVKDNWYVDDYGVLHSRMTDNERTNEGSCNGVLGVPQQGFFLPLLEGGKYAIAFRVQGRRWERSDFLTRDESKGYWNPTFNMEVVTEFDEIKGLINDRVIPTITNVNGNITTIVIPRLGEIKTTVDNVHVKVVAIDATTVETKSTTSDTKRTVLELQTSLKDVPVWTQQIHGYVENINRDWTTVVTNVGNIKLNTTQLLIDVGTVGNEVDAVGNKVEAVGNNVTTVSGKVDTVNNNISPLAAPSMIAVALSAIAAVAAVIAAVVVVRRLKVAS